MGLLPLPSDQVPFGDTQTGKPTTVFYTWLKSFADLARALFGGTGPAWAAYTPTVTPNTGSITSYTATGRFYQLGKAVFVQVHIVVTNAGTGSGTIKFTLPVPPNNSFNYGLAGWETVNNFFPAAAVVFAGSSLGTGFYTDGTTLINTNADISFSGVYEAA